MKIKIVNYMDGEVRFVLEEFPDRSFCISLKGKTTQKEITDKLKFMLPEPDTTKQTFNDLNLKSLEGKEI